MADTSKPSGSNAVDVAVLLVTDGGGPPAVQAGSNYKPHRARYTKSMLRSTLQLMGCKPRTAHKVCRTAYHPCYLSDSPATSWILHSLSNVSFPQRPITCVSPLSALYHLYCTVCHLCQFYSDLTTMIQLPGSVGE